MYNLLDNMMRNRTLLFEKNIGIPQEVLVNCILKIDASYSSQGKNYYRIVIDYLEKIKIAVITAVCTGVAVSIATAVLKLTFGG